MFPQHETVSRKMFGSYVDSRFKIFVYRFREAETDCAIALQLDPNYVKALHRRALALKELNQLPEAHDDLQKALQMEPLNGRLKADLTKIEKLISERVS